METFKEIEGFDGNYVISSYGKVYSRKFRKIKVMSSDLDMNGFPQVWLTKRQKQKIHKVSRLVATHYIDNPDKLSDVLHKDGDKTNNHFLNLQWISKSERVTIRNNSSKSSGKSRLLGAVWNGQNNKWCSVLKHGEKRLWLGFFGSDVEAHQAYLKKMHELGITNRFISFVES